MRGLAYSWLEDGSPTALEQCAIHTLCVFLNLAWISVSRYLRASLCRPCIITQYFISYGHAVCVIYTQYCTRTTYLYKVHCAHRYVLSQALHSHALTIHAVQDFGHHAATYHIVHLLLWLVVENTVVLKCMLCIKLKIKGRDIQYNNNKNRCMYKSTVNNKILYVHIHIRALARTVLEKTGGGGVKWHHHAHEWELDVMAT